MRVLKFCVDEQKISKMPGCTVLVRQGAYSGH
nr:MAG TPA: hypothetical protein [Caudoviricetes sp.]